MTKWFPRPSIYILIRRRWRIINYIYITHIHIARTTTHLIVNVYIYTAQPCRWRTSRSTVINGRLPRSPYTYNPFDFSHSLSHCLHLFVSSTLPLCAKCRFCRLIIYVPNWTHTTIMYYEKLQPPWYTIHACIYLEIYIYIL